MKKTKIETKIDAEMLAERVQLLFAFCAELIPHKEMFKDILKLANDRLSFTKDAAPILGAFGRDWEADHFDAKLKARRAKALYNLIDVLDTTEKERLEFSEKQEVGRKDHEQIEKMLGL